MKNIYEEFDLAEFMRNCVRKFYYFVIFVLVGMILAAAGWVYKTQWSPTYSCRAVILVSPKDMTASELAPIAVDGKIRPNDLVAYQDAASSYTYLVQNPWVADRALEELGKVLEPEQMSGLGLSNIFVTVAEASPFLNVVVSHSNPAVAAAFLAEVLHVFPEVMADLNISTNLTVINYPEMPGRANFMSLTTALALGIMMGLGGAFVLLLFKQICYTNFQVLADVEHVLGIELLGIFPMWKSLQKFKNRKISESMAELYSNLLVTGKKKFLFADCYRAKKESCRYMLFDLARKMIDDGYRVQFLDFCELNKEYRRTTEFLPMWEDRHFSYQDVKKQVESQKMPERRIFLEKLLCEDAGQVDFTIVNFPEMGQMTTDYFCLKYTDMTILLLLHKKTTQKNALRTLKYLKKAGSEENRALLLNVSNKKPFSFFKQLSES